MADPMPETTMGIPIRAVDEQIIYIEADVVPHCRVFANLVSNRESHGANFKDDKGSIAVLSYFKSEEIELLVKYYKSRGQDGTELTNMKLARELSLTRCEEEFFGKLRRTLLIRLLELANYVDAEYLMTRCAKYVAACFETMSASEMRLMISERNDLNARETQAIRDETSWYFASAGQGFRP